MNAGKDVHQLMAEIELPPHLQMTQVHGKVSWAVRSIWEYYETWFHFERTTDLYEIPRSVVASDITERQTGVAEIAKALEDLSNGNL